MKITQDLRAEGAAMGGNERKAMEEASAEATRGMAAKSAEFLARGGKLYV